MRTTGILNALHYHRFSRYLLVLFLSMISLALAPRRSHAAPVAANISGTVVDTSGKPLSGVKISLSGDQTETTFTSSLGKYSFTVIADGAKDYAATPSDSCVSSFSPTSRTFTDITIDQVGADFTATLNTVSISGNVTVGGSNKAGVTIKLSGGTNAVAVTDGSGNYTFSSLDCGETYVLTPSLDFHTFTPQVRTLGNVTSNQLNINFTGARDTFTLEGYVTDTGTGVSGVTISVIGGPVSATNTNPTDSSGHYSFTVFGGETYQVTPSKSGYEFTPASSVTQAISRNSTENFSAKLKRAIISGQITDGVGPVSNVLVTLSGDDSQVVLTNSQGSYSFLVSADGVKDYTVTPTQDCFTSFAPASKTFTNITADSTQDFTGLRKAVTISGTVTVGGVAKSGVTIKLSGGINLTATTDGSGNYSFSGLDCGKTYVLTPSLSFFNFTPTVVTLQDVIADTVQNFTGTQTTFTLSGFVTTNGIGVQGVSVQLTGGPLPGSTANPTSTDADGHYSFTVLGGETYTVTPSKDGLTFKPPTTLVNEVSRDTGVSFTADQAKATINGLVTDGDSPVSNVQVTLSGSASDVVFTNASGLYSFRVDAGTGKNYTVTPAQDCFLSFNPTSKTFTNLLSDASQDFIGTRKTVSIVGNVKADGANKSGVTVSIAGGTTAKTETDASGNYNFTGLECGKTYIVTPSLQFHSFDPSVVTLSNLTSNSTQNFTGSRERFTLEGVVTFGGSPLAGVTVRLTQGELPSTTGNPVTTDANGHYSFEVFSGESYTVTPTKDGSTFSPPLVLVQQIARNTTVNFTADQAKATISGLITDGVSPVANVQVTLSGSASDVVFTNASGLYSFRVDAGTGKNYTVTPVQECFLSFNPTSKTFTNLLSDASQDFIGTRKTVSIVGNVKVDGANKSGVTVSLAGGTTAKTETDASGNYNFTGLECGKTYIVTPSLQFHSFDPSVVTLSNLTSNSTQNFTGSRERFTLEGVVTLNGSPLAGVTVRLTQGELPATTGNPVTTDANGHYSFEVFSGESYTVTPTKDGSTFSPPLVLVQQIARDTTVNFIAQQAQVTIGGQITDGAAPIANVRVTLSGSSSEVTLTNSVGRYSFTVEAGTGKTYTVTPFVGCAKFQPSDKTFADLQASVEADFAAVPDTSAPVVEIQSPSEDELRSVPAGGKTSVCWTYTEQCPQAAEIWIERWDLSHQILLLQTRLLAIPGTNLASGTQSRCDKVQIPCGDSLQPYSFRVDLVDSSGKKGSDRVFDAVVAQAARHCINGTIRTADGCPLANVSVKIGSQTIKTNANGFYEVCGVPDGTYAVAPQGKGFSPPNYSVTLACETGDTGEGLDFTGPDIQSPIVNIASPTQSAPVSVQPGGSFSVQWSYSECSPVKAEIVLQIKQPAPKPPLELVLLTLGSGDLPGGTDIHTRTDTVTVGATVPPGTLNLLVRVADKSGNVGQDTENGAVVVVPAPAVTGITPSSGGNNGIVSITNIAGTGFASGATVKLTKAGETDIVGTSVSVKSSTQITCSFDLTGKALGLWNVVVTNPNGLSGTLTNGFSIFDASTVVRDLVLTSFTVSPNPVSRGKTAKLSYVIENQGNVAEAGVVFRVTLNGQLVVPQQTVGTIDAGALATGSVNVTVSSKVRPGDYLLLGEVLAVNGETNTDNNKLTVKVTVTN